ncbi:hypothetical protein GGX14DRAFT_581269 [Mycena pura]|uniref:DNA 3'-5' helicase n=1 Tax=Mycena pura TaxID=153505 RepID=A0AAD6UMC8_9AGAR|nr:hypothetical protein GGX14DRAFT_581269 [Mycena pura]
MAQPDDSGTLQTLREETDLDHITVTYHRPSAVTVDIVRDDKDQRFHCIRCEHKTMDGGRLRKHAKTCTNIPSRIPETPPASQVSVSRTPPRNNDSGDVDMPDLPQSQSTSPNATPSPQSLPVVSRYRPQFPEGFDEELAYEEFEKYFVREPDKDTIFYEHKKYKLWKFDLVINKRCHALICQRCEVSLHPNTAHNHVSVHYGVLDVPEEMIDTLVKEFSLLPPKDLPRPTDIPPPIFGLKLPLHDFHFCGRCGRGYEAAESLRTHHATSARCTIDTPLDRDDHIGPGQRFTSASYNSYFAVDITKLPLRSDVEITALQAVLANPLPKFNYSLVPFATPQDEMTLSIFAKSQKWAKFLEGQEPAMIYDSRRSATKDDGNLYDLQSVCVNYFMRMQPEIESYLHFGVQRLLAQVGPTESIASYNTLKPESVEKYARYSFTAVFNFLRQVRGEKHAIKYPLNAAQVDALKQLDDGLKRKRSASSMQKLMHAVLLALYSHKKESNRAGQFFSPVICFAVFSSYDENGQLQRASTLTSQLMQLVYAARTAQFTEMRRRMDESPDLDLFAAYNERKEFLIDMRETPIAWLFNAYNLLRIIAAEERCVDATRWNNAEGTELTFLNRHISISDIGRAYKATMKEYEEIIKTRVFFGDPPDWYLTAEVRLDSIVDDVGNRHPGHCFIDNIQNEFNGWAGQYERWLLSDAERARQFVVVRDGKPIWRPGPTLEVLEAVDDANDKLALLFVLGTPVCSRGSEFGREYLRNSTSSPVRNVQIVMKTLVCVVLVDKTSQKRLAVQVDRVGQLLSEADGRRFHESLHPRLRGNLASVDISEMLGDVTMIHLRCRIKILAWRKLVGTIWRRHGDPDNYEVPKNHRADLQAGHTSKTADAHYVGGTGRSNEFGVDRLVGCLKNCAIWHRLVGIEDGDPIKISDQPADRNMAVLQETGSAHLDTKTLGDQMARELVPRFLAAMKQEVVPLLIAGVNPALSDTVDRKIMEAGSLYWPKPIPAYAPHELRERSSIVPHPRRRGELRQALGDPKAQFVCYEQGLLLELFHRRGANVLVIMRCGTGKSFVSLVAVKLYAASLISVWVMPLHGLHHDLLRRGEELGLTVSRWRPGNKFDPNANVVYTTVEDMNLDGFKGWMKSMCIAKRISWLIFDESHKLLTDIGYRDAFKGFEFLGEYGVPVFALSATLPPHMMQRFFRLSNISAWEIIRQSVCRPNIRLAVERHSNEADLYAAVQSRAKAVCASYGPDDRLMVFTQTRKQASKLAELLETLAYCSELSDEGKALNAETVEKFRQGLILIIVCTSILGSGFDYGAVRDVFIVHFPYTAFDLQQQFDRAGRDNKPARATTFILNNEKPPTGDPELGDLGQEALYVWGHEDKRCLREIPSIFCDGVPTTCTTLDYAEYCQNCDSQSTEAVPGEALPMLTHWIRDARAVRSSTTDKSTYGHKPPPLLEPRSGPVAAAPINRSRQGAAGQIANRIAARPDPPATAQSRGATPAPPLLLRDATPARSVHPRIAALSSSSGATPAPPLSTVAPHDSQEGRDPKRRRIDPSAQEKAHPRGIPSQANPEWLNAQRDADKVKVARCKQAFNIILDKLRGKCPACWVRGKEYKHAPSECGFPCANDKDKLWQGWHERWLKWRTGFCYHCLVPEGPHGWHIYQPEGETCKDSNLLKPAIFGFFTQPDGAVRPRDCQFLPDTLFGADGSANLEAVGRWLGEDAAQLPHMFNAHTLILWLIFKRRVVKCPSELQVLFPGETF